MITPGEPTDQQLPLVVRTADDVIALVNSGVLRPRRAVPVTVVALGSISSMAET